MNSFHIFSRMMVVVSVLVCGNVMSVTNKVKVGAYNFTSGATSLPGQAVLVQGVYKATKSDNATTLAATGVYFVKNINGQFVVDNGALKSNKNANSMLGITCKTGLYGVIDRSLRAIESTASEYGINQKAITKKAEEYLPEQVSEVVKQVLPFVVEAGHGFVVRSVTESGAAFVAEKAAKIGEGSQSDAV